MSQRTKILTQIVGFRGWIVVEHHWEWRRIMIVGDVLVNFRSALRALVPCAVRAGIGWRREDAYDEWDEIAASVFKGLVHEPLRWALPEPERERFELPPYDLLLERYTTPTLVEVILDGSDGMRIFHALGTRSEPFDVCECLTIDEHGVPTSSEVESHALESVRFRLRHRTDGGRGEFQGSCRLS